MSAAQIAALFALWSFVAVLAEVPAGAWADRYSRRAALVVACMLQAAGFSVWMVLPTFAGFAAGFVLWGVGGALASGAFEALLYDGLAVRGAAGRFPRALAMAEAAAFAVQLPVALAAAGLLAAGGHGLVGAVSVAVSLVAAGLATTLHDERPAAGDADDADGGGPSGGGYLATLATGVREALVRGPVRILVVAIALLAAAESLEEIFPLLARAWGVPDAANPLVLVAVPVAGAIGSLLGGRAAGLGPLPAAALAALAAAALTGSLIIGTPAGVVGLTLFYGVCRLLAVVASARLQARIEGSARATVTSVASLGSESAAIALYGALALGGLSI